MAALERPLFVWSSQLTVLPALPNDITRLYCQENYLSQLPELPPNLRLLVCYSNQLTGLPTLPETMESIACFRNMLETLPLLPPSLHSLECWSNRLTQLPELPPSLRLLECDSNPLTSLPDLPEGLWSLKCSNCPLRTLPDLPQGLRNLDCTNCELRTLPRLPPGLVNLRCEGNFFNRELNEIIRNNIISAELIRAIREYQEREERRAPIRERARNFAGLQLALGKEGTLGNLHYNATARVGEMLSGKRVKPTLKHTMNELKEEHGPAYEPPALEPDSNGNEYSGGANMRSNHRNVKGFGSRRLRRKTRKGKSRK